uniref:Uncharacterized protein n=1 Tax=Glossina austeni TaxID=7395 RepID=A0A1A9V9F2_GLOAU
MFIIQEPVRCVARAPCIGSDIKAKQLDNIAAIQRICVEVFYTINRKPYQQIVLIQITSLAGLEFVNPLAITIHASETPLRPNVVMFANKCRALSFNGTVIAAKSNDEHEFYCKAGKELCSMIVVAGCCRVSAAFFLLPGNASFPSSYPSRFHDCN